MVTNTPREKAMINVMEKVIPTAVETQAHGWLQSDAKHSFMHIMRHRIDASKRQY